MTTTSYTKSSLARQAEKLLYEDPLASSDSSLEFHRSLSPKFKSKDRSAKKRSSTNIDALNKSRESSRRLNQTTTSRKSTTSKRMKSPHDTSKIEDLSKSRTLEKRSNLSSARFDELVKPHSCQQEKYHLRLKINDLEETLTKQNQRVKKLYGRMIEKRQEVQGLTDKLMESKKQGLVVLELKETIKALETNEHSLVQELEEQQKVARNALDKFYELQDECLRETEKAKRLCQDHFNQKLEEHQLQSQQKMRKLEEENWKLSNRIREMETMEEIERTRQTIAVNSEIVNLKNQLNDRTLENERLRLEIQDLKQNLVDSEREASLEIKSLKHSLDNFIHQNRSLKQREEEIYQKEIHEKNLLKRKVDDLQDELENKNRLLREKDFEQQEQLEKFTRKVSNLQADLKKLNDYEARVDELQKSLSIKDNELELTKKYYKEKLESRKNSQEQQKKEWTTIYNELLAEIKSLKGEIESLGGENRRLITSIRSKERDYY